MKPIRTTIFFIAVSFAVTGLAIAQQGRRPGGPGGGMGRLPGDVELEKPPLADGDFEKTALAVLADIQEKQSYRNVPEHDGRLLRIFAASIGARNVIEIGTSTGYSGIWLGLALKETGGKMITYEIDPERAATAQANFTRAGMDDIITLVLGDAHEEVIPISRHWIPTRSTTTQKATRKTRDG